MIPFKRGDNPLSSEEEKTLGEWWRNEYLTKKASKLKPIWSWNRKYNLLKDALFLCNNDHCAYCDCHPLKDDRGFEIDHFKPKSKYRLEAFTYINLFPCCNECNKKGNSYHISLLKPDEIDYQFEDFFRYDSFTGEILPNLSKSDENQKRASKTIEIFRLNIGNKPRNRITAIKKEIKYNTPFDERPYRYGY
jgi:uncharacterized protein (TIGR02646 family)